MNNYQFLKGMYSDTYFPNVLVDKIKDSLENLCTKLEDTQDRTEEEEVQMIASVIDDVNELENEFYAYDSEIETAARETILEDVEKIMKHYQVVCDFEEATGHREW